MRRASSTGINETDGVSPPGSAHRGPPPGSAVGLEAQPDGQPEAGQADQVARRWAEALGDQARVVHRDELIASALMGEVLEEVADRILRLADDEPYRREGKAQANLVEGRHDLARRIYHGKKGEMVRAYYEGMEDQLSALGLVLNCVVLWNTVYCNRALDQLRDQGYPVLDTDAERLSAFIRDHIGIDGHYAFHLPDLGGTHRPLRDPDSSDDD